MLKLKPLLRLALFATCLLSAAEARADTVVLTGGAINVFAFDEIRINQVTGTDGFSLNGGSRPFSFNMCKPPILNSPNLDTCSPGQAVNGNGSINVQTGAASVTLGGVEFPSVALQGSSLSFATGPFKLFIHPPTWRDEFVRFTFTVPFTMTGTIVASGFDEAGGSNGETLFTTDVVGSGMANIFVLQTGSSVFFAGASFAFQPQAQPTPEPATLLLLGGGLAGVAARVRRRKSRG